MLIRTKLDWSEKKDLTALSEDDRAQLEAKIEYVGEDKMYDELYEDVVKDAIIDTVGDKLYVQIKENQLSLRRLLDSVFVQGPEGSVQKYEDQILFEGTLDELYENLEKEYNNKNKKQK